MRKLFLFVMAAMCCAMTVSAIEGALPGAFTVSKEGAKIQFSKGNLQYQASTGTWRFAEHQWDIIGEGNENISPTYAGWIDLFGWGTSGYNGHYPYLTTTDPTAYGEVQVSITGSNYDWGVYNPISNGGNEAGLWRTMEEYYASESWYYILRDRTNAKELWGLGTVNGVCGLILLPDDWTLPSGGHFVPTTLKYDSYDVAFVDHYSEDYKGFDSNKYTIDEWQIMEDAGAVFFPTTGFRKGTEYKAEAESFGQIGCYWSSTAGNLSYNPDYKKYAGYSGYALRFIDDWVHSLALLGGVNWRYDADYNYEHNYYFGFAVRLVTPYKEEAQDSYRVTITQPEHGTIFVKETDIDLTAVEPNTVLHFVATPDEGYLFEAWSGCKSDGSLTVTKNVTVTCSFKKVAEEKKLTGKFTVDAEGKQVIFSSGNLQFNAKQGIWQFAENQYDIIGDDNANISATYGGWIDLFGWGTSGYNSHNPWMTSEDNAQYGDGANDIAGTDYDWGQYCPINNGGQKAGLWQTLTFDEWMYIIDNRTDAKLHRGQAAVAEVEGFVLLPDDWTLPTGASFSSTEKNTYTAEQWKTMEDAGAVFLPCGGFRKETAITYPNAAGVYWSASNYTDEAGKAQSVYINGKFIMENFNDRSQGLSVRLVKDVKKTEPVALYGVKESDGKTLTLYYDDQRAIRGGEKDWAMKYYENTTKIILDESVKEARPDNLEYWFADFNQLTEVEHLDYLNTSDVTNMNSLFLNCYALTELDLSAFDTKKVESMGSMFGACTALKELNLNSLDVQKVTDAWGMFKGCAALKTIHCDNDWSEQLPSECDTEEMFEECTSLVGGKGTAYSAEHTDGAYARPDEGESKPGYFTASTVYYTVTFLDWDGTFLFSEKVEEGHDAKGTEVTPTREGYTFTGWSKPITNITADLTVIALYEEVKVYYTVTFLDWDGTFLFSEKVEEGHDAKGPDTKPTREGYKFVGWSKPITNITADLTVIALYEQNPPTGIDQIVNRKSSNRKLIIDGVLYIEHDGKILDATGRLVK